MFDDYRHLLAAVCLILIFMYYYMVIRDHKPNTRHLDLCALYIDKPHILEDIIHKN